MKFEKLKCPFKWDERKVMVEDFIWYIPPLPLENYQQFQFPGWDSSLFFPKQQPIKVEYCSGNGAWIADRALKEPSFNWIAIEKKFERVKKIWSKIKNLKLTNLLIICGEGFLSTHQYFPPSSVEEAFVNFPDPWPKTRHAKHRIIQLPFVDEVSRILKPKGNLTLVTDDTNYSQIMIDVMHQSKNFKSAFPDPYFISDWEDYGTSYFEELWRQKGKEIYYHQFIKDLG